MGGFPGICIFLGVLGKRFGDVALKDIVVEAGLIGNKTVDQALKGKHYNNAYVSILQLLKRSQKKRWKSLRSGFT